VIPKSIIFEVHLYCFSFVERSEELHFLPFSLGKWDAMHARNKSVSQIMLSFCYTGQMTAESKSHPGFCHAAATKKMIPSDMKTISIFLVIDWLGAAAHSASVNND